MRPHIMLRGAMYLALRRRGWAHAQALGYATRNPRSFDALADARRDYRKRSARA